MAGHVARLYDGANALKANFSDIYEHPDPRSYYAVLGGLDYVIPEVAGPAFLQLAEQLCLERGRPITILDLGCSYGVNTAIMRYGITIQKLRERYLSPAFEGLPPDQIAEYDYLYFSSWPRRNDIRFLGLDASAYAIRYARRAGLLEDSLAINLERDPANAALAALVSNVDMIISTGCVGYVGEKTFARILDAMPAGERPWIASFVLRMFDFEAIAGALQERDLETEKFLGATFVQRRFRDRHELEHVLALLTQQGIDPAGKESEGLLHAELFVSRPAAAIEAKPLHEMVSLTSGGARAFGDRHRPRPKLVREMMAPA